MCRDHAIFRAARRGGGPRATAAKLGFGRLRSSQLDPANRADPGCAAPAQLLRVLPAADDVLSLDHLAPRGQGGERHARPRTASSDGEAMTAGHFIFIPAVLLVGVVIGWVLGSRAARDAFAVELKRREE